MAWYVGEDIVCDWGEVSPAGESFCSVAFAEGDSNIIAEVRDPGGAGARADGEGGRNQRDGGRGEVTEEIIIFHWMKHQPLRYISSACP